VVIVQTLSGGALLQQPQRLPLTQEREPCQGAQYRNPGGFLNIHEGLIPPR
jgi:hypothetical protein